MFSFRSMLAAACVCLAAALAGLTPDVVAGEKKDALTIKFKEGDVAKALKVCPGGKIDIEFRDGAAQLSDATNGKKIGGKLTHDPVKANVTKSLITCWAFSPDGKLVVTGSRCDNRDASEGQICVWEVATGVRVTEYYGKPRDERDLRDRGRLGNVQGVAFSEDSKTILFQAKGFALDGP